MKRLTKATRQHVLFIGLHILQPSKPSSRISFEAELQTLVENCIVSDLDQALLAGALALCREGFSLPS